jgi:flagellar basal-body rod modification protein FlgD
MNIDGVNNTSFLTSLQQNQDKAKGMNSQIMSDKELFQAQLRANEVNAKVITDNKSTLGQEDFLTLLIKELEYQDPLEPMDNKEFIGQMAQFSNLQQTSEIGEHLQHLITLTDGNQTLSMLGKWVAYVNPNLKTHKVETGVVDAIKFDGNNQAILSVNGEDISPYDVIQVNAITDDNNKE